MRSSNSYGRDNPLVNDEDVKDHSAIGASIEKDGKILVFKHVKYGWWTIPIGKVKDGEKIEATLHDEILEELGIEILEYKKLGDFTKTYDRGSGIKTKIDMNIFRITNYQGRIKNKEPDKHTDLCWLTPEEILKTGCVSDATLYYILMTWS